MKTDFGLQNLIENGNGFNFGESKGGKKSNRANQQELQFEVGIIFNEICQMLDDNNIAMSIDREGLRTVNKIHNFKAIVQQLIQRAGTKPDCNTSNAITCPDCQTYEASLQKLEGEVRQHIRIEQQLKIFQDNLEEKIDEMKKEKKETDKKAEHFRKQFEEAKKDNHIAHEKLHKLEGENDHYKKQIKELKRAINHSSHNDPPHSKRESHKHSSYAYESKENKIDWMHKNTSIKKDEKERGYERKSIEKRSDSAEKNWRMSNNAKSNKMISIMNDKLLQEKSKEERRRVIQSKFDYRR